MRPGMDGYDHDVEARSADIVQDKRNEQEINSSTPASAGSMLPSRALCITTKEKTRGAIQPSGEMCSGEWQDMMMELPDEQTITQLVAAVCGPQNDDDHHQDVGSVFLSNTDTTADWCSESDASYYSDSLSEAEDRKSMSTLPTPPRDRESQTPDSDHTLAALDDCDTAMSLCQFLTQENEAIGKLIDQLHSPPPTPVSNASSVQRCQPPVKIKQEPIDVSNTCIAPLPALYVMQTHPSSLFYVSSLANAATDMPTATATQEIEVKNELPPCSVGGSSRGRTLCTYSHPCDFKVPGKRSGAPLLWQFLLNLLESEQANNLITWTNRCALEFKILDPSEVAKRWGKIKNRPAMNYEKLSRSLRGYYLKGIMEKVVGEQYAYRYKCHPDIVCMTAGIIDAPKVLPLL
ncbi:uncharacterized protein LOC134177220 isoform X2 [Corticium candelabrum]|uniref:uncharacterized protein LOC134177220 isoform X2 n=1 Tax=Corticium candelabrum TaxID=121492 RepID=UPI002E26F783|nr:uncharacterized protein LOC134177220 isoform X2 [Corticium candelabrum]